MMPGQAAVNADPQRELVSPRKHYDVARDCLVAAKGDRKGAASRYVEQMRRDRALLAALMWPLLEIAVRVVINDVANTSSHMMARIDGLSLAPGGMRAVVSRAGEPTHPKMSPQEERETARSIVMRDWYSARLYGGMVRLGDATRPQLEESAARRFAQARGFMKGGNLEKAIAARLKDSKQKVRDALTPVQIHEIARGVK